VPSKAEPSGYKCRKGPGPAQASAAPQSDPIHMTEHVSRTSHATRARVKTVSNALWRGDRDTRLSRLLWNMVARAAHGAPRYATRQSDGALHADAVPQHTGGGSVAPGGPSGRSHTRLTRHQPLLHTPRSRSAAPGRPRRIRDAVASATGPPSVSRPDLHRFRRLSPPQPRTAKRSSAACTQRGAQRDAPPPGRASAHASPKPPLATRRRTRRLGGALLGGARAVSENELLAHDALIHGEHIGDGRLEVRRGVERL